MNRINILTHALVGVLVVLLAFPPGVFADDNGANQTFSRQELDQMLAPVALYPDSLVAQILVAATFPTQVVEADRWVKANKGLSGDQLNAALDKMDWDLSVKALVPFPQVLAMMDEQLDWTTKLGEAFLARQSDVMASVQQLRNKAYAQGNLKSTEQQKVVVAGDSVEIQPTDPQAVYVPYYSPSIYGSWWWPGYPPFAFYPYGDPFFTIGALGFLAGVAVGPFWNWGWGSWNWGGGFCNVNINRNININRNDARITRNMRTSNFHQFASRHGAGMGRTARGFGAGRTGTGGRPSVASVQRGLSQNHAGLSRGGTSRGMGNVAHNGRLAHGGTTARGGSSARGSTFARGSTSARGGSFARNSGAARGSNFARGGDFGRAGGFARGGGGGVAHGGGGGFHGGGGGFHGGGGGGHGGGRHG